MVKEMVKEVNVLLAGVGGQGTILMSELLGDAAVSDGLNVRGSEALGMAVRGGPVVSTIRIGSEVYGPLIPMGKCDVLVGLELVEALRNITYLSKSGSVILNIKSIVPFAVLTGKSDYPSLEKVVEKLSSVAREVVTLNASQIAEEAGSLLAANIVMLGALVGTGRLPIKTETIKESIKTRFSAKLAPVNIAAFDLGYQAYQQAVK